MPNINFLGFLSDSGSCDIQLIWASTQVMYRQSNGQPQQIFLPRCCMPFSKNSPAFKLWFTDWAELNGCDPALECRAPAASRLAGPTESSCLRRASVSLGWTLPFNLLPKEALLSTQRGTSAVPDHSSSTRSVALVRNPLCRIALRNKCLYQRK